MQKETIVILIILQLNCAEKTRYILYIYYTLYFIHIHVIFYTYVTRYISYIYYTLFYTYTPHKELYFSSLLIALERNSAVVACITRIVRYIRNSQVISSDQIKTPTRVSVYDVRSVPLFSRTHYQQCVCRSRRWGNSRSWRQTRNAANPSAAFSGLVAPFQE